MGWGLIKISYFLFNEINIFFAKLGNKFVLIPSDTSNIFFF